MKKCLFMLVLLGMLFSSGEILADSRADYDRYVAAYNSYRDAVNEKRPLDEIMALLEDYRGAKTKYELGLNKEQAKPAEVSPPQVPVTSGDVPAFPEMDVASGQNQQAQATSSRAQPKIPDELKSMFEQLWSPANRQNPDAAMRAVQAFINANPESELADIARYELAKAFEFLKDDEESSRKVLAQIVANNPRSPIASLAQERMRYLDAGKTYDQWKNVIGHTYQLASQKYEEYRKTSWLAFPVKFSRWFGYAGKQTDFNRNRNNVETFQIQYESLASRFVPPVDITFDRFKPATGGNASTTSEIALHYSNSNSWLARWKLLSEARHSIDIQYFIMEEDIFGHAMLGALLLKAREGVKIRLMLDARGTKTLTRKFLGQALLQTLFKYPNVEVKVFRPVNTSLVTMFTDLRKVVASNHDKILVVDDEYSIIGGRNVSAAYFVDSEDYEGAYRDTDVVIRCDSASAQLSYAFVEEFNQLKSDSITQKVLGGFDRTSSQLLAAHDTMYSHLLNENFQAPRDRDANGDYLQEAQSYLSELGPYKGLRRYAGFDPLAESIHAPVKIVDSHSLGGPRNDITDELVKYIDGARREIVIQNPYVVLTERMFNALKRASARGVPIIMHTNSPYSTDSLATQAMFYADWKKIMAEITTMRIFVYASKGKLHAKNWVFDGVIGIVGTYNLDFLSEQVNSEVLASVKSPEFARLLRSEIMKDVAVSKEYKVELGADGKVIPVHGPDDLPGKSFWLLKGLSKLTMFKKLI